ncbi:hypothetical protein OOT00_09335 [Desulfobotulus sp. H1]|uniref:Tetratricopeptide repeat protein n=1 Tax=Desulfobotulus pelophilus TaxID=2823377 RepID=A0ABT3N9R4_9BACT|nr:hypothetical protein [Desulfobotulus pelophilus]MCW7754189.1 hypothetical protein [Desulfobotulus pelophilus]
MAWQWSHTQRLHMFQGSPVGYTLPSGVLLPLSLRFKGLISNFIFLKTITTLGEEISHGVIIDKRHQDYVVSAVEGITDLDPRFWEPYQFAVMILSWDLKDFKTARILLEKAMKHRAEDWRPPYYIGFNCLYFQGDATCGAHYMGIASDKKNAPSYLPMMAIKLAEGDESYKPAIFLLRQSIEETQNPHFLQHMQRRLQTFELMDFLEERIRIFHEKNESYPETWEDMITEGLLKGLPEDPYGGKLIMRGGRVYTTSGLLDE